MAEEKGIGSLLKELLEERSLSMRRLSTITGVDTATISRIVNGKQQAKPKHLKLFASGLGVPLASLYKAAGYEYGTTDEKQSDLHASVDMIREFIGASRVHDLEYTIDRVKKELVVYEHYARTEEGEQKIMQDFETKVQQVGGAGPFIEQLKQIHRQFSRGNVSPAERAVLGSALLYFILSTDIIPDYIFPIGYLDDAIAVKLVLNRVSKMNATQDETESVQN
ncbi:DUF1232 domain-containing protein [Kroppenstedtia eburnea]|uniref:DUF1232 domain-containing protein n=1 Tax=Kroppenstedtia eburnea TaxID=714067 RepID=UPI0036417BC9